MTRLFGTKTFAALIALGAVALTQSANACAACFGKSDSPLAKGMNWGIFSLLAVVVFVLASIASVAIYLARRSAAVNAIPALPDPALAQTQKA